VSGYLTDKTGVFVTRTGPFGNYPQHLSIEEARAMAVVLQGIVDEHDDVQKRLTAEYGPAST
jgi:hypothetical protein